MLLVLINLQVVAGKLVEQGPVIIISFQTQQIVVARNAKGEVVEGDPVSTCIVFGILGYYKHKCECICHLKLPCTDL